MSSMRGVVRGGSRSPSGRGLASALVVTLGLVSPWGRAFAEGQQSPTEVNAYNGALQSSVPIAVPPFRGLEPKVTLAYSSRGGNGAVGIGWGLGATSTIVRAAPGKGAPRYDATDIYLLDGDQLIASCTKFGGQYCTRTESFRRITYDGTNNLWYVYAKDGTKYRYGAAAASRFTTTASHTYAWYLDQVQDAKGNTVTYTYWTDTGVSCGDVFLDNISYNGNTVKLYWQLRPDTLQSANGDCVVQTRYNLKSIAVRVGASLVRAYGLAYGSAASSGQSLLSTVTQFDRNATVDAAGTITGGASLPPLVLGWKSPPTTPAGEASLITFPVSQQPAQFGIDFDGDGKDDVITYTLGATAETPTPVSVQLSTGSGFGASAVKGTLTYYSYSPQFADVNGDGRPDIVYEYVPPNYRSFYYYREIQVRVLLHTGTSWGPDQLWATMAGNLPESLAPRDVDGDGKADFIYRRSTCLDWTAGCTFDVRVLLSTGTAFGADTAWATGLAAHLGGAAYEYVSTFADLNGDGKADLVTAYSSTNSGPQTAVRVRLSTGAAFTTTYVSITDSSGTALWLQDVNGDGKADVVKPDLSVLLSTGNSVASATSWGTFLYARDGAWLADVTGDGLPDIVYRDSGRRQLWMKANTGKSFAAEIPWAAATVTPSWGDGQFVDLDGDGRSDFVYKEVFTDNYFVFRGTGDIGVLLGSIQNGIGGTTTIGYQSAATLAATDVPVPGATSYGVRRVTMTFPTVSSLVIADGRGEANTTLYTYAGAAYNFPDREFLGFRYASTTLGATGAYSETYYWQRAGTIGKPQVIYKRTPRPDGVGGSQAGAIMSFDAFAFTDSAGVVDASPPYESLLREAWGYECNGHGVVDANQNYVSGCRRVYTTYGFDIYGNITAEYQYGDYDLAGDERTAVRSFAANTASYIVGLPAFEEMHTGLDTGAGSLIQRTVFYYDGAGAETTPATTGLLTKKGQWNSQTGGYLFHQFGYDAYGNETSYTDPVNRSTTKGYDPTYHVYVTATTNALGHATTTEYDYVIGQPTKVTDPNANFTTTTYTSFGQVETVTSPDGATLKHEQLNLGQASSQRKRVSRLLPVVGWVWEDSYFDGLGRIYQRTSSTGVTESVAFGASGKPASKTLPYAVGETPRTVTITYDELGRELTLTNPGQPATTHSYDNGTVTVTDPQGKAHTSWFDAANQVIKISETLGGTTYYTTFTYDVLRRRIQSVDALNNVTQVVYDSLGRVIQKSDPDQGLVRSEHNDAGQVVAETDAAGNRTTLQLDALGRVISRTYPDLTQDTFTFDEAGHGASKGRLTTARSAAGVMTLLSYSKTGRRQSVLQRVDGQWLGACNCADSAGRLAQEIYPDGEVVTYGYATSGPALGKLVTVTGSVAGTIVANVAYTPSGAQTSALTYGNNVTTSYSYEATTGRTAAIQVGALGTINYGYDPLGRVTSMSSAQLALTNWAFGYDELGRLTGATNTADSSYTQSFTYDVLGRMLYNSAVGNYQYADPLHPHAATAAGTNTYAYNTNGGMVSGPGRTLTYDFDQRPTSIVAGGQTTTLRYDAVGGRAQKSTGAASVVYLGGLYEQRGTAATKYYYAGGARVAVRDASGNRYFHADHLGSTRLITNQAGAQVQSYDYAPYGKVIAQAGSAPDSHRFTGQEADDETGLMFYQARYYDPVLARFIQPDAFLPNANSPQALDVYAYANNNPINYVDPSGHAPLAAATVAIAGAMGVTISITAAYMVMVGVVGLALVTFVDNPIVQTIGMMMIGAATGYMGYGSWAAAGVGAAVSLAQSPVSPLDPTIKKAIGWAWTAYGCVVNMHAAYSNGAFWDGSVLAGLKAVGKTAWREVKVMAVLEAGGFLLSKAGSPELMQAGLFLAQIFDVVNGGAAAGGPLTLIGASYDLGYTLAYPDGKVYDLRDPGAGGREEFAFYYHTGYESPIAFGRQHIAVGDPDGGYWEVGTGTVGWSPGINFGGWVSTQKVTVVMSSKQAAVFRMALAEGAKNPTAGYVMHYQDSYAYPSLALNAATGGKFSASDLHINPGLFGMLAGAY